LQEREHGFIEKPSHSGEFFRKGTMGQWRKELTQKQIDAVIASCGPQMMRLQYL